MNPVNNTGWLKFLNEREYYYKPRQMPKSMLYDWNSDYLPPSPYMIPFAKNQNIAMKKFASLWNENFKNEPAKQILLIVIEKLFDGTDEMELIEKIMSDDEAFEIICRILPIKAQSQTAA